MYSANTAVIAAPPHRRRRPALSCLQCRRRKVKCDQKSPCSHCQRSKDTICTYGPQTTKSPSSNTRRLQARPDQYNAAPQLLHHIQPPQILNPEDRGHIPTPDSTVATLSTDHSPFSNGIPFGPDEGSAPLENREKTCDLVAIGPSSKIQKQALELPTSLYSPYIERHVNEQESLQDLNCDHPLKTKLFGENHWMNHFTQFERICAIMLQHMQLEASSKPSELNIILKECKVTGRAIKAQYPIDKLTLADYKDSLPSRNVCDELVAHYLRTFESFYRILHIPSFQSEYENYWSQPQSVSNTFIMKLLLVLAIGTSFWQDPANKFSLRLAAHQWIFLAQHWLAAPLEKSRMNLGGIQVQCLLLLAREAVHVGSDLVWISAGTLLRTAIQLGYHRDPKHFPNMSFMHGEMRRRLWATILGMATQTAYASALPSFISLNEFDTQPPANIDDDDIKKSTRTAPASKPLTTFTQTSLQLLHHRSLKIRLEILRITTSFQLEPTYDEILQLHRLAANMSRDSSALIQSYTSSSHPSAPTAFHLNYFDLVTRYTLLCLHRGYCIKARTDPRYYFSRKVCFDAALSAISAEPSADWSQLRRTGGGFWRETCSLPCLTLSLELIMQLEEEALNPPPALQLLQAKAARVPLIQALRDRLSLMEDRIQEGDVNIKGHLFTYMTVGQIEAMERGEDADAAILEAAAASLAKTSGLLKRRLAETANPERSATAPLETTGWDAAANELSFGEADYDYDFLQNSLGMDFDMPGADALADWEVHSWF